MPALPNWTARRVIGSAITRRAVPANQGSDCWCRWVWRSHTRWLQRKNNLVQIPRRQRRTGDIRDSDLGDIVPQLPEIKAKAEALVKFRAQIELGDWKSTSPDAVGEQVNELLDEQKDGFRLEYRGR